MHSDADYDFPQNDPNYVVEIGLMLHMTVMPGQDLQLSLFSDYEVRYRGPTALSQKIEITGSKAEVIQGITDLLDCLYPNLDLTRDQ